MAKTRKHRSGHRQRRRHTRCKTRRGGAKWKWPSLQVPHKIPSFRLNDYLAKHSMATLRKLYYNSLPKAKLLQSVETRPLLMDSPPPSPPPPPLTPKEYKKLEEMQKINDYAEKVKRRTQEIDTILDQEQERIANEGNERRRQYEVNQRNRRENTAKIAAEKLKILTQEIAENRAKNKQIPLDAIREIMTENPMHDSVGDVREKDLN